MTKQTSQQQRQDYIAIMKVFLLQYCVGSHYDTCTACPMYNSTGCGHPEHPQHKRIPASRPEGEQDASHA